MWEILGINKAAALAGAVGAALAALQAKGQSKLERGFTFLAGFALACYLPALVIAWFGMKDAPQMYGGLGFFFGYLGMSLMEALLHAVKEAKTIDWKDVITSWVKR
jgi:hypothetical protein